MFMKPEGSELRSEIGQLFMAGIPGPDLDEGTETLIREHGLAGVILFSRNIEGPLQIARLCRDLQEKAMAFHGQPLFLAVDQEGGRVARLKAPFTEFPGNAAIGMDPEPAEEALQFARVTAKEMKLVGLNMNLAPVLDVQRGELEKHLAGRSFGEDPGLVARLGRLVIRTLQENGVMAVAKHFPGLGRTDLDPHLHLPRIDVDVREIEEVNLPPFAAAFDEGVSAVMTSHAVYPAIDALRPATLSHAILSGLLRDKMGFEGLIITDDLEMGAISGTFGAAEGAAAAFKSGADILLVCREQAHVLEAINLVSAEVVSGEIPYGRIDESRGRILQAKERFLGRREEVSLAEVRDYFRSSS